MSGDGLAAATSFLVLAPGALNALAAITSACGVRPARRPATTA
jgi:hypothetical protein